ncbi:MAG: hypothetical protein AB7T06_25745 [Kofleriaceae bacterium]
MLDLAKAALPWMGTLAGLERTDRGLESGNDFRTGRAIAGTGLAAMRGLTVAGGAGTSLLSTAGAGAGAGLGMAAGLTDSFSVLGAAPSPEVEMAMTGALALGGGIAGGARPDTLPFLAAGGLGSSVMGMAATSLDQSGNHALAAGAAMLGMGSAGAGIGGAIGESVGGPMGAAVGAGIGGGVGLVGGGIMEIAQDDAADERVASISDDHGLTGGEAMGIGSLALGGALAGGAIGSIIPAVGTAIGAGVGAGVGAVGGLISSLWD